MGLVAHYLGGGDREVMDAYNVTDRGSRAKRAWAVKSLRGMDREGRLLPCATVSDRGIRLPART
jgi:hypothetical protein